ncbi:16S rRNA (uracil(1498)-N(3))-methyltransferase [Aureibacillus halotolerans]|uniref:Ribosomal RNA small subunit methyltransferase E n=1 Tax=Aureibacillus halotolerans TaxID=1508390 RepID=A0A4R6TYW0_9BACI|nr:16S rRNA (uracil(1498)-N(3))-methyltransferase [Aureibacillus halotolerans]TDQ38052.1 16S rRNA (uracil1498-N3)-methyltransferase [Aureibacillus halotolerans]
MQRYFIDKPAAEEGHCFSFSKEDSHHIATVMRMNAGDRIEVCFSDQALWESEIATVDGPYVTATQIEQITAGAELPVHITIAQGLLKGDKTDWMIQKSTELGASAFLFFKAHHAVVKWDEKKAQKKRERQQTIVKEAAEQSKRTKIPHVHPMMDFSAFLTESQEYDKKWVAYEREADSPGSGTFYKQCEVLRPDDRLLVVFGPEGGFADSEIEQLLQAGFETCRLGPRILRAETAPMYLLSAVSFHFES